MQGAAAGNTSPISRAVMFRVSRGRRAQGGWGARAQGAHAGREVGRLGFWGFQNCLGGGGNYPLRSTSSERPTRDLERGTPKKETFITVRVLPRK